MIAGEETLIVLLLGPFIAGYMFHRVRSMPQTSTHHYSLDESVHSENDAILLPNGWSERRDCNVLHFLHVDNRLPQPERFSCENLSEMRAHFVLPLLYSSFLLRAIRIMMFNTYIWIAGLSRMADKSAVCAINRHLRVAGLFCSSTLSRLLFTSFGEIVTETSHSHITWRVWSITNWSRKHADLASLGKKETWTVAQVSCHPKSGQL